MREASGRRRVTGWRLAFAAVFTFALFATPMTATSDCSTSGRGGSTVLRYDETALYPAIFANLVHHGELLRGAAAALAEAVVLGTLLIVPFVPLHPRTRSWVALGGFVALAAFAACATGALNYIEDIAAPANIGDTLRVCTAKTVSWWPALAVLLALAPQVSISALFADE